MDGVQQQTPRRRRGRPPKHRDSFAETRELLLRAGLEVLTEKGFSATGIEEVLRREAVPKGSFYYYFENKETFGLALIDRYAEFFGHKLDTHFLNSDLSPLERVHSFIDDAAEGMERFEFRRGCLIGNLGQEMAVLPESFRLRLTETFEDWQARLSRCLQEAQRFGELSPEAKTQQLASFFWTGWEGAVLRARLEQRVTALRVFEDTFFAGLPRG